MSNGEWYVAVNGEQQGPMTVDEILGKIRAGGFDQYAHVYKHGMENWVPITAQDEFQAAFASPPSPTGGTPKPPGQVADEIEYKIFGEEMQFVEITLDPNEACIAEAGSFMYMEPGIEMKTIFGDGSGQDQTSGFMGKLLSAGKRVLTGESLFMTVFGNSAASPHAVAFASPYPGQSLPRVDADDHRRVGFVIPGQELRPDAGSHLAEFFHLGLHDADID